MIGSIDDAVFGRLKWDPGLDSWLGGIDWPPGLHTEVMIRAPDGDQHAADFSRAGASLAWLQSHERWARDAAARNMVGLFNDISRGWDDPRMSAGEYFSRIELSRIVFESDGPLVLSYILEDESDGHIFDAEFSADRSFVEVGHIMWL